MQKKQDEKVLRSSKLKHYTVDTRKDGVKFKTNELKKLSDEYETLRSEYDNKQYELVQSLLKVVCK
jgi:DNA mismatch repair ATPase MutS